jgi:glycosyltransferase involved in cell wall biosynthesis
VDPSKVNLAFIGRFDRQKGAEILLRSLADLERDDMHLYLLGDFDRERAGADLETSDPRVTRLGWIRHEEIDNYISCFDAVVIPSRWEGFGLVALEAMRNSKAVVVSNRGGLPEQVIDGFNGYVFPLEEPATLTKLLASLDKRDLARLGANGRQVWVSSFADQKTYRRLNEVYHRVIFERAEVSNDVR